MTLAGDMLREHDMDSSDVAVAGNNSAPCCLPLYLDSSRKMSQKKSDWRWPYNLIKIRH